MLATGRLGTIIALSVTQSFVIVNEKLYDKAVTYGNFVSEQVKSTVDVPNTSAAPKVYAVKL
jgi:hypothetical protein